MKLLVVDTSSQSASCALLEDDLLLGEFFTNVSSTHSQTILPMVHALLEQTRITPAEIDLFGVTTGPGSFTGLRIGLSAIKGMAHALGKPCVGVSTLESLACGLTETDALIAPVLDARCKQVYTALFRAQDGQLARLSPDEALPLDQLAERLKNQQTPVFLVGDGARMCYNQLSDSLSHLRLAPAAALFTRASAAALACARAYTAGQAVAAGKLVPAYLRLPQAERELLAKNTPQP